MKNDYSSLDILLKLSSKQQMVNVCQQAFLYRKRGPDHLPEAFIKDISQTLGLSARETRQCVCTLGHLLKTAVFNGSTDPKDIFVIFPAGFHKNLRDLITKIIIDNMDMWKEDSVAVQVSLPKLVDFDWRVDTKTSSDSVARMSVPTCILNLQIQPKAPRIDKTPQAETVNVELSKETLDTMLDGLGKIRDQLASVANR
ncbi:comm domain-containing protein 9-like [Plakobranchus ocellatus]|uniref:Comm domain-containing protein 9-like n=1 Tax=Plakobranchus ocellatus TaxID=259542 RepID=A0AAV3Y229_9GAST|nr:comm domain-containing protein 9-like [Plakobranchus ocellatus]